MAFASLEVRAAKIGKQLPTTATNAMIFKVFIPAILASVNTYGLRAKVQSSSHCLLFKLHLDNSNILFHLVSRKRKCRSNHVNEFLIFDNIEISNRVVRQPLLPELRISLQIPSSDNGLLVLNSCDRNLIFA